MLGEELVLAIGVSMGLVAVLTGVELVVWLPQDPNNARQVRLKLNRNG